MTDFSKRLGYGGSAVLTDLLGSVQVLITSGGMEETDTPSFLDMMDINPTQPMNSRSRTLHADGVASHTGSLGFDLTTNAMPFFSTTRMLRRGRQFNIGIHDGENRYVMTDCYLSNLVLAGAPGGFITVTLSYMAKSAKTVSLVTNNYILDDYYGATPVTGNQPVGYWWSGGADVKEWTFTMNQAVEPMYANTNPAPPTPDDPQYLRVGLIDYQLDVTLYAAGTPSTINICTTAFTLTGVTTSKGYTFNGVTDLGMYNHTFITAARTPPDYKSDGVIIT